jgi:hypothetical protein
VRGTSLILSVPLAEFDGARPDPAALPGQDPDEAWTTY